MSQENLETLQRAQEAWNAEDLDGWLAELDPEAVGDPLLERDQRRAVIVGSPPFALDDLGAPRDFAGIGQAAVALQHPFGVGRGLEVFRLDAAGGDDAPAHAEIGEHPARVLIVNCDDFGMHDSVNAAVVESIKRSELHLSDTQLGFVGTGFIIVYTLTSPFFGTLGDRRARPPLIAIVS